MQEWIMFKFCPSCASQKIKFEEGKVFRCSDCSFVYYHNIAAANGCLISVPEKDGERIVFTVRAKEPAKGKLDLPGGFVDVGESVIEGLTRELQEEIGWTSPNPDFRFFCSFSNVYAYKGIDYNTCDLYFTINAPGLTPEDLRLEEAEISGVRFLRPEEIDMDQLAFESTKKAVKTYIQQKKGVKPS